MQTFNGQEMVHETRRGRVHYVNDETAYPYENAYAVEGWRGVAWRVYGWQTAPDEDTEWSGIEERTGLLVCVMIGDDEPHTFEPGEVARLDDDDYCAVCGQIGCTHDGRERAS